MAAKKASTKPKDGVVVAKAADGAVQITFKVAWVEIEKKRREVVFELAKNVEVPGFRKGKAPLEKAEAKLDKQFVLNRTLSQILPQLFSTAIKEHKLRPAMYPKFELLHAHEGEDWEVRATTAELPEFELGDYEKVVKDAKKTEIWTPEKGDFKKEELSREQKENIAINALAEHYKFGIPKILVEEEANSRLASLLERIEKLGLSLESYLASIKKTAERIREEYEAQAERAIRLDILLGRIAEKEKIRVEEGEISSFLGAAKASGQSISEDQKNTIASFLIKRKVLEKLADLV